MSHLQDKIMCDTYFTTQAQAGMFPAGPEYQN